MSIVVFTGSHPRHHYFAGQLAKTGLVSGVIIEDREEFVKTASTKDDTKKEDTSNTSIPQLSAHLKKLYDDHFLKRAQAEESFFGSSASEDELKAIENSWNTNILHVPFGSHYKDGQAVSAFLEKCQARLVLSYGCTKISPEVMAQANKSRSCKFWNTHGGLSPYYRGTVTHFWPSYFLEPQMTGMTLHETTENLDGGAILLTTSYSPVRDDTLHMVACRTVKEYVEKLAGIVTKLDFDNLPEGITQKSSGKLFVNSDWRPEHLYLIYDYYKDNIVNELLDGNLEGRVPKLINVFE